MGNIVSLLCPCLSRDKPNFEEIRETKPEYDFKTLEQQELQTLLKYYMLKASQR